MTTRTRDYSVQSANVAVSAVQDLISLYAASTMGAVLQGYEISQVTGTGIVMLRYSVKRLSATVTPGSVGTAVTPRPMLSGDAAATITARANDTTQATTSGTSVTLESGVVNIVNGTGQIWFYNTNPSMKATEAIILSLDTAPSPSLNFSVTAFFGEGV